MFVCVCGVRVITTHEAVCRPRWGCAERPVVHTALHSSVMPHT